MKLGVFLVGILASLFVEIKVVKWKKSELESCLKRGIAYKSDCKIGYFLFSFLFGVCSFFFFYLIATAIILGKTSFLLGAAIFALGGIVFLGLYSLGSITERLFYRVFLSNRFKKRADLKGSNENRQ